VDIAIGIEGLPDYIALVKGRRDEALGQDYHGGGVDKIVVTAPVTGRNSDRES
jgi:hypothetical protein